jgi:DNA-binding SARP family transcriptional activator
VPSEASTLQVPAVGCVIARPRLTGFVERAGVGAVVMAAPSGYGKSTLAAQIAASPAYAHRAWVPCSRSAASDSGVVASLAEWLAPQGGAPIGSRVGHVSELAGVLPEGALCVVLDDVRWVCGEAIATLAELMRSKNECSLLIVTSRLAQLEFETRTACVAFSDSQMLFNDGDAEALLALFGVDRNASADGLLGRTGGHPALAALLARHEASRPRADTDELPRGVDEVVAGCVADLDEASRTTVWVAACLGEGAVDEVCRIAGPCAARSLRKAASVMPLVTLAGVGRLARFSVHRLVQEQVAPCGLEPVRKGLRSRVLAALIDRGDCVRAVDLLLDCEDKAELLEWLPRVGRELNRRGEIRLLGTALDVLEPADLVRQPALLVLRAKAQWASGDANGALASAGVAVDLAGASDDGSLRTDASLLVSRIHLGVGSYSRARVALEEFIASSSEDDAHRVAFQVHAQLLVATCLLGDRDRFNRETMIVSQLMSGAPPGSEARARLLSALGLGAAFGEGNMSHAARLFQQASDSENAWVGTRLDGRANYAAALLRLGRTEQARLVGDVVAAEADKLGFSALRDTCYAILSAVRWSADGDYDVWKSTALAGPSAALRSCDRLSAALNASYDAEVARAAHEFEDALVMIENGLRATSGLDAPILRWALQLEQAAAMAGLGDVEAALLTTRTIGARAREAGAGQQVAKAATIEAECLVRSGDHPDALLALEGLAAYVRTESANWMLGLYVRAYPALLGPLAAAVGVERLPAHLLRLIPEPTALEALSLASSTLRPDELESLSRRMLGSRAPTRQTRSAAPDPDPAVCTVRLFGAFEVRTLSGAVPDRAWGKRKARLLFAMMASRSGKDVPRDQLVEYLWPGMTEQRALNNFYVVWSAMKRALAPEGRRNEPCPYVEHVRGVCRVVSGRLQTDLDEFERLLVVARKARAADDQDIEMTVLAEIADLYRGELLPGDAYDDWFGPLRERCRHDFEDAMLRLAIILEARDDPQGGLAHLRKAMLFDPWREDLYQAALRLQIAAGQRSAAIETYLACRARLVEDLGIDPSAETRRLYEHVLGMEA